MVAIVRTEWDGTSGGPGLTQFACLGSEGFTAANAQAAVTAVRKFWQSMSSYLPDELKLTVMPVVDIYNEPDAQLMASVSVGAPPAVVAGIGNTGYAGGAGFKINWNTGVIRNGRRIKGATFVVPALATCFGNTGTVTPTIISNVNTATQILLSDLTAGGTALMVWSRPLVKEGVITRTGAIAPVVSGTVNSKSAILRGRRD